MTVIYILVGIAALVFIISKLGGESNGDAAVNAAAGAYMGGSCLLQIFLTGVSIFIVLWLFNAIF